MMKLASQVEYLTSLMKLAWRSMSTSSLTVLCHSSPIFLFFYDIGLAWEQIVSLWQIMLGWIPDMSNGCQANRSVFLCRTSMIRLCLWLVKSLLSCVHYPGWGSSCSLTSSSIGFGLLSKVSSHESTSNSSSRLARWTVRSRTRDPLSMLMT